MTAETVSTAYEAALAAFAWALDRVYNAAKETDEGREDADAGDQA